MTLQKRPRFVIIRKGVLLSLIYGFKLVSSHQNRVLEANHTNHRHRFSTNYTATVLWWYYDCSLKKCCNFHTACVAGEDNPPKFGSDNYYCAIYTGLLQMN